MERRNYSAPDRLLMGFDQALRTVFGSPHATDRSNPSDDIPEAELDADEQLHSARLMRIDHTGEVCAQALYQGQALTARLPQVREAMQRSAEEEGDHLEWCHKRLWELGNRRSMLNPLWYTGSFLIGAAAGLAGDKWSLGFIAETEDQVCSHLDGHLQEISQKDQRSRAILTQMREDEMHHARVALDGGGAALPGVVKLAMKLTSKVMTKTVYWI